MTLKKRRVGGGGDGGTDLVPSSIMNSSMIEGGIRILQHILALFDCLEELVVAT